MIIFFKDFVNEARLSDISFLFGDEKNDMPGYVNNNLLKTFIIEKNVLSL